MEIVADRLVVIDPLRFHLARCADPATIDRRHRQIDVIDAKIGIKLAIGVKLVAIPAGGCPPALPDRLPDPDLGKPLTNHGKGSPVTCPRKDSRQTRAESNVEHDLLTRLQRLRQWNPDHCLIISILVIRMNVLDPWPQILATDDPHLTNIDPAPLPIRKGIPTKLPPGFTKKGALLILEGIEVEVELELPNLLCRSVEPGQLLPPIDLDRTLRPVELQLRIDPVPDQRLSVPLRRNSSPVGRDDRQPGHQQHQ